MDIDSLITEVQSKLPPAPLERITQFEQEIGATLPDDYRDFLIRCNGGFLGGSVWFNGPTPNGDSADAGIHHIGGFRKETYFSLEEARRVFQIEEAWIPDDLIWIMDDPFGNAICLGVKGFHRGRVFFWDHENIPDPDLWDGNVETAGNLALLANSFSEFVAGLAPMSDE